MPKIRITPLLKTIIGNATGVKDQLNAVFSVLEEEGDQYQKSANEAKGAMMGYLAEIAAALDQAGILPAATRALRNRLKKHNGTGQRRKHEKQSFVSLAAEAFFGIRRSTASRYARVTKVLVEDRVKTQNFGAEIVKRGGIEKMLPSNAKQKQKAGPTPPEPGDDKSANVAGGGDIERENAKAVKKRGEKSAVQVASSNGSISILVPASIQRAIAQRPDGKMIFSGELEKVGTEVTVRFLSFDPAIQNHVTRNIAFGLLDDSAMPIAKGMKAAAVQKLFGKKKAA